MFYGEFRGCKPNILALSYTRLYRLEPAPCPRLSAPPLPAFPALKFPPVFPPLDCVTRVTLVPLAAPPRAR